MTLLGTRSFAPFCEEAWKKVRIDIQQVPVSTIEKSPALDRRALIGGGVVIIITT
jgi:hypothetical protein